MRVEIRPLHFKDNLDIILQLKRLVVQANV
jgi:hypothetical protein